MRFREFLKPGKPGLVGTLPATAIKARNLTVILKSG